MHAPSQNAADNDPKGSGKKTELRRQYRTEKRPRGSNGGKMVPK